MKKSNKLEAIVQVLVALAVLGFAYIMLFKFDVKQHFHSSKVERR